MVERYPKNDVCDTSPERAISAATRAYVASDAGKIAYDGKLVIPLIP